ncbi:phage tail tape measure protein [Pelagibacterium montanilacus]|uniref:phage tail tape measure protein n=1 Tax=Pelagibacterium montanilacus TaxID=2185280 RepID=UPI000F8E4DCE|nr:phage tail tape measure protein [Pelagibacterium montanilacus]
MSEIFGEAFERELGDATIELERIRDLGNSVGSTLTRSLRGAMMEGRSLRGLLADIGRSFADIALKAALRPLGQMVGGSIESLFAAFNPALGPVQPFAKGGVISTPSYFPMPGRWGLAGEAGPEAIMPLRRGPDGRLGVAAGTGGQAVNVTFNVAAQDARSFVAAEAEVSAMLARAVRRGGRGT